jgi:hypothetical protein
VDTLSKYVEDPELVVYVATNPGDVLRIRREVEGRRWAASHGIPTAETVARDVGDRWLVSRRVADEPGEPATYLAAALEMSQRIQRLPHPCFATSGSTWRAPRRSVPLRVARMAQAGIDLRAFVTARGAVEVLPHDTTVHNDYHRQNVLNTAALGHVTVIDWEFTALGPRHQDMVRLIVDIQDASVAQAAWLMLVDSVPPADHGALAAQLRWLTIRTYASEVTVSRRALNAVKCAHRRERWRHAQSWADELSVDPWEAL